MNEEKAATESCQSHDYVSGKSGWKASTDGTFESNEGIQVCCPVCQIPAWVPTDCGNPHEGCPRFGIARVVVRNTPTREQRIARALGLHRDIKFPVTLVNNEDLKGRIPGDIGYRGPGK